MENQQSILEELVRRHPALDCCVPELTRLIDAAVTCFRRSGTFFVAGNGGSGADADHICGELLKGFRSKRALKEEETRRFEALFGAEGGALARRLQGGLPAVSLLSHPGFTTAFINDVEPLNTFAQQLWALAKPGDVFLAISTGGGAENLRRALMAAQVRGVTGALLTGNRHGICEKFADIVVAAPESETYKIQELHLPLYHAFCAAVESNFWELTC